MNRETIRQFARRIARDERGAAITEYLIIVALIAILCVAAYREFGEAVENKVRDQIGEIEDI
jgi:Flp pilus assembly pilin Flp